MRGRAPSCTRRGGPKHPRLPPFQPCCQARLAARLPRHQQHRRLPSRSAAQHRRPLSLSVPAPFAHPYLGSLRGWESARPRSGSLRGWAARPRLGRLQVWVAALLHLGANEKRELLRPRSARRPRAGLQLLHQPPRRPSRRRPTRPSLASVRWLRRRASVLGHLQRQLHSPGHPHQVFRCLEVLGFERSISLKMLG